MVLKTPELRLDLNERILKSPVNTPPPTPEYMEERYRAPKGWRCLY